MPDTKKRIASIDSFRCLAAILVVAAHSVIVGYHLPYLEIILNDPGLSFGYWNLGAPLFRGHMGVWIFFCISGYTMSLVTHHDITCGVWNPSKSNGAARFWKYFINKRLLRIYPLFAVHIVFCNLFLQKAPFADNLISLLMLSNISQAHITFPSTVMWSLVVEIQFYLIFPFIFHYCYMNKKKIGMLCLAVSPALFLSQYIFWNPNSSGLLFVAANNLPAYIFYFLFGMLLFESRKDVITLFKTKLRKIMLILCIIALLFFDTGRSLTGPVNLILLIMTAIVCMVCMIISSEWFDRKENTHNIFIAIVSYLGRASYSIYLFHGFAIYGIDVSYLPFSPSLIGGIKIVCGCALGCVAYHMIEKPLLHAIQSIKRQKPC
jgi:peptidoglycan/LPS O-acetylase OafA/YrhL